MGGGFGSGVVGAAREGDDGETGGDDDDGGGLGGEGDQVWHEEGDHVQGGEVVGGEFGGVGGEVDGGGVGEQESLLEAGVEEDGVEGGVGGCDAGRC